MSSVPRSRSGGHVRSLLTRWPASSLGQRRYDRPHLGCDRTSWTTAPCAPVNAEATHHLLANPGEYRRGLGLPVPADPGGGAGPDGALLGRASPGRAGPEKTGPPAGCSLVG